MDAEIKFPKQQIYFSFNIALTKWAIARKLVTKLYKIQNVSLRNSYWLPLYNTETESFLHAIQLTATYVPFAMYVHDIMVRIKKLIIG